MLDEAGHNSSGSDTVGGRLAALAAEIGGRATLFDLHAQLSYRELFAQVEAIAGALQAAAQRRDQPVAVLAPLDHRFYLAFLGVLRAGGIALVLDPEHPPERLARIASHAGAQAVITVAELAAAAASLLPGAPVLTVETATRAGKRPSGHPRAEDPAYILYTSGSTGTPKGVAHSHANLLNDSLVTRMDKGFTPSDAGGVYYAGTMGPIRSGVGALLAGSQLHVLPARQLGAEALVEEIRRRRLTIIQCVPTLFRRIAAAAAEGGPLESVRLVRMMGERSGWSDYDLVRRACGPETRVQISLGSTECSSSYATWIVDETVRSQAGRLPVGRATPGVTLALRGEDGAPVPDGQPGEAIITGRRLALGYWREPELTEAAFSAAAEDPEMRSFATGDICLRRPDGLYEFVGRKDKMLKIRGHRVEPDEVEAAIRACPGLADAVVVVRRDPPGRPVALAAYAEPEPEAAGLLPRHVMAMISRRLPGFMMPAAIYLQALPRLANFKPDRQALEAADQARRVDPGGRASDPLLDEVALAFEAVVGRRGATGEDDLLSLGGDSLQSLQLILEIEKRFDLKLPAGTFRRSRNISELAAWIRRRGAPVS